MSQFSGTFYSWALSWAVDKQFWFTACGWSAKKSHEFHNNLSCLTFIFTSNIFIPLFENKCVFGSESLKPRCWWFCRKGWLCVRYKTAALINDDCDECWKQGGAMSCGFVNHLSSRTGPAPIQDWHLIDQEASWIPNQPCRDCFYWELGESLCMSFSPHGSFINCFIWGRNIWKIK